MNVIDQHFSMNLKRTFFNESQTLLRRRQPGRFNARQQLKGVIYAIRKPKRQ